MVVLCIESLLMINRIFQAENNLEQTLNKRSQVTINYKFNTSKNYAGEQPTSTKKCFKLELHRAEKNFMSSF